MKTIRLPFLTLALLLGLSPVASSRPGSWGVSAAQHTGFLAGHNPTMLHLIDDHIRGTEVTLFRQTTGTSPWQQHYRFPQTGINFLYLDLPSDSILGDAYGLMAFIDMPLLRARSYRLSIRASCGLGYLTGHFERVENHKNSAIGSALNAAVQIELENTLSLASRLDLQFSVGLTHFSNGSFATPNLGLNNVTASCGLRYLISAPDTFIRNIPAAFASGWHSEIVIAAGTKEIYPPDNGKYFSATFNFSRMKQVSHKSRWGYGGDLFYDTALNDLIEVKEHAPSDVAPFRAGVHASYHLVISRLSALMDFGIYVVDPYKGHGPVYNRLGLRYRAGEHLFLNLSLKTHFAKAEYTEWGLGWMFN